MRRFLHLHTTQKECLALLMFACLLFSFQPRLSVGAEQVIAKNATLAAGSVGGAWHYLGGVWGKLMNDRLNILVSVEATRAGQGNIRLVNDKTSTFGMTSDVVLHEGYNGIGWAKDTKYQNIRAMFPLTVAYFQWWGLKESNIKTIADLNGKTLCLSTRGSEADTFGRRIVEFSGVKVNNIVNAGHAQCGQMLQDNIAQVHAAFADTPHPAPTQMAASRPIQFIPFSASEMAAFLRLYPYLQSGSMPANTYVGQQDAVLTLVTFNSMITNKDVDEKLIYAVTKATFETRKDLLMSVKAATALTPEGISKLPIPLAAGAVRFYKEMGINIRNDLIPPEMR